MAKLIQSKLTFLMEIKLLIENWLATSDEVLKRQSILVIQNINIGE